MKNLLVLMTLCFGFTFSFAQSEIEKQKILSRYDTSKAIQLQEQLEIEHQERELRVNEYLINNNLDSRLIETGNGYAYIKDIFPDGTPMLIAPDVDESIEKVAMLNNGSAAATIRADELYSGGSLGLNIQGLGMTVGVWEVGGVARQTHEDLTGRMTVIDGQSSNSFHATHVTGTVISSGSTGPVAVIQQQRRGIAFEASASVADANNDYNEMNTQASTNALLVSNHSYGIPVRNNAGVPVATSFLGQYDSSARSLDQITFANPFYLVVMSAGNGRNDGVNAADGGYDILTGDKNAKNNLVVGAVNQVTNYTGPSSVTMSDFSSWGPTDDGRIKPDVVGMGVGVQSTSNASDTAYGFSNGTSMSSPTIAGLATLLQQYYNSVNGNFMRSASLKGLILHTADEAGSNPGPDYAFGWGLANGEAAANLIMDNNGADASIEELTLADGDTLSTTIEATGGEPLEVSICWTDPAGQINTNGDEDNRIARLVNDLDVQLESGGTTYFPWSLNVRLPSSGATRNAKNNVDNFEKIEVDNPTAGQTFTLTISHEDTLDGGSQNYSLVVSGGTLANLSTNEFDFDENSIKVYPNPASDLINIVSSDSSNQIEEIMIFNTSGKTVLQSEVKNSYNVSGLASGVYFIQIKTEKGTTQEKFIKK